MPCSLLQSIRQSSEPTQIMAASKSGFSGSNDISNSSSIYCGAVAMDAAPSSPPAANSSSLRRLSDSLETVLLSPEFNFFADATIALGNGREIPVHRCILSARSAFFKNAFMGKDKGIKLDMKEMARDFEIGIDSVIAVLSYLYSGKVKAAPADVCRCVDDECSHAACRPAVDFLVQVLYASFTFQLSELVDLFQGHLLDILDKTAVDDVLVILSVSNICGSACQKLLSHCIEIVVRSDIDTITLEKSLPHHVSKQVMAHRAELGLIQPNFGNFPDKHVKRIHRALDSDDVELVRMLLREADTSLDDACAIHYAVAYCDSKTTIELLDLGIADVNRRNLRGYTVLHVAAMRKEPKIIVSLLIKGAKPSDLTSDGRKALQISKRLTKAVDYFRPTEEGKPTPNDRLCVEILEQAERRDPLLGEAALSLAMAGDDLRKRLLYMENRVGLAKLLFPIEAKVVLDIAEIDETSEFPLLNITSRNTASAHGACVDLNEAPFKIQEEHLNRMRALSKAVELGRRFFPRCSAVIDKILNKGSLSQITWHGDETPEERQAKRQRYMELQDVVSKAYTEDKEEFDKCNSSISLGLGKPTTTVRFPRPGSEL